MRLASALLVGLLAPSALVPPALADWRAETLDDGTWFQAHAQSENQEAEIACGGRSIRQLTPEQSQVIAPVLTRRGELQVSLRARLFMGDPPPRQVRIRIDRLEYPLTAATYDRPRGMFVLTVPADDPAFDALLKATRLTVVPEDAGPIPLDGAGQALGDVLAFCQLKWAALQEDTPDSPARTKALAFAARHTGDPDPEIRSLKLVDLNGDGMDEALLILGGRFCGARRCDGFVLDLSGETARSLGSWAVATLNPGLTRLNGWLDVEVNGATRRYTGGTYAKN